METGIRRILALLAAGQFQDPGNKFFELLELLVFFSTRFNISACNRIWHSRSSIKLQLENSLYWG